MAEQKHAVAPRVLFKALGDNGIDFFTGVPDSLLKDFCAYVTSHAAAGKHVIASNEGTAVALAAGYHLATGKIGLVYMQNSGQGNAANPLISLADPEVYGIPLLLLVGWRGRPGTEDEPQHIKQGKITLGFLDILGIPYKVLSDSPKAAAQSVRRAKEYMAKHSAPYALVVREGTFEPYQLLEKAETDFELTREGAVKLIIGQLGATDIVVSTTGKMSRELFELREKRREGHGRDFLTVGSMGHASSIALGIAMQKVKRQVFCFDGDGAVIMHMGALAVIGQQGLKNYKHIIFNNGAHDSVGGQPTAGFEVDFTAIAKACGYKQALRAETAKEVREAMEQLKACEGPAMLEIRVNKGARPNLGRPASTPVENKTAFIKFVKGA